jgi:hypothetical protein
MNKFYKKTPSRDQLLQVLKSEPQASQEFFKVIKDEKSDIEEFFLKKVRQKEDPFLVRFMRKSNWYNKNILNHIFEKLIKSSNQHFLNEAIVTLFHFPIDNPNILYHLATRLHQKSVKEEMKVLILQNFNQLSLSDPKLTHLVIDAISANENDLSIQLEIIDALKSFHISERKIIDRLLLEQFSTSNPSTLQSHILSLVEEIADKMERLNAQNEIKHKTR